jgi:hypothetical protein
MDVTNFESHRTRDTVKRPSVGWELIAILRDRREGSSMMSQSISVA